MERLLKMGMGMRTRTTTGGINMSITAYAII